ncbi:MAG: hypothetical protein J7L55_02240 [Desulfurococcales archaeon]|nr:hypothetical protein [Desulfurococcales archaeon]
MKLAVVASRRLKSREELERLINALHALNPDALILLGWPGLHPGNLISKLKSLHYLITSPYDDILITKTYSTFNALLDGKMIELGGVLVAGIGGLNTLQDILKVKEGPAPNILITYHAPHGCGDLIKELGVRKGIPELNELIKMKKPPLTISKGLMRTECRVNGARALTVPETYAVIIEAAQQALSAKAFRLP